MATRKARLVDERGSDRGPEHRHREHWVVKYWSLIMALLVALMSGYGFYFNTQKTSEDLIALAADHADHERYAATSYVNKSELALQLQIRDGLINNIRTQVEQYRQTNEGNFRRLDEKLDRLIEQVGKLQRNGG